MHNIILKPILTEKLNVMTEKENRYGFIVAIDANKIQIKQAVEKKFSVNVVDVTVARYEGKKKMVFRKAGRFSGKRPDYKKAYVRLKKDQKIDLFEQV